MSKFASDEQASHRLLVIGKTYHTTFGREERGRGRKIERKRRNHFNIIIGDMSLLVHFQYSTFMTYHRRTHDSVHIAVFSRWRFFLIESTQHTEPIEDFENKRIFCVCVCVCMLLTIECEYWRERLLEWMSGSQVGAPRGGGWCLFSSCERENMECTRQLVR